MDGGRERVGMRASGNEQLQVPDMASGDHFSILNFQFSIPHTRSYSFLTAAM